MADTANDSQPYIVQSGDTLSGIAAAHGMSTIEIEKLNPQLSSNFNLIHTGQAVHLSGGTDLSGSVVDGLSGPTATAGGSQPYIVKPGDNLSSIAAAHGMSLPEIERLNPQIHNFSLIHPGETVHLSGGSVEGLTGPTSTLATTTAGPVSAGTPTTQSTPTSGSGSGSISGGASINSTPSSASTVSGGAPVSTSTPASGDGSSAPAFPLAPVTGDLKIPTASITITDNSHPDSTNPAKETVETVRLDSGSISVHDMAEAAGETPAAFVQDNNEYKTGGSIATGHHFEIPLRNIPALKADIVHNHVIPNTPNLTGSVESTTVVSGTPAVAPSPLADVPSGAPTLVAPPSVQAPPPAAVPPPTGNRSLPGGLTLVDNSHPSGSTPGQLVQTVIVNKGMPVAYAIGQTGETKTQFVADNREYSPTGYIQPGRTFEIRTSQVNTLESNASGGANTNASGAFQGLKATGAALLRGSFLKKSKYNVGQAADGGHSVHNPVEGGQAIPPASDPVTKAVFDKPGEKPHVSSTKP